MLTSHCLITAMPRLALLMPFPAIRYRRRTQRAARAAEVLLAGIARR